MIGEAAAEPDGWGTTKRVRAIQDGCFVDAVIAVHDLRERVSELLERIEESPPSMPGSTRSG